MSREYEAAATRGPDERRVVEPVKAKTSAAAAFSLVFGLSALFCALALFLSPLAVLFGLIALVLGIVGISKSKLPGVTGRGVAIGGLVLGILGLLIGIALLVGVATFLSNEANINRIESRLEDLRAEIPSEIDAPGG